MKKALIITSVIIGILLIVQMKSFNKLEFLVQRAEPKDFFAQLKTFQIANADLRDKLAEDEKMLNKMNSKIASDTVDKEIQKLTLLNGNEAVSGEGVEITLSASLKEFWITDLIAQLVSAGAEAISINDIRLLDSTAGFREVGGGLVMRSNYFRPPFKLVAIGPEKELAQTVSQNGGILDRIRKATPGMVTKVEQRDKVTISPQ